MAPFWADADPNNTAGIGEVSYEVHSNSNGGDLLANVSEFISEKEGVQFSGVWMLVADWSDLPEFNRTTNLVGKLNIP